MKSIISKKNATITDDGCLTISKKYISNLDTEYGCRDVVIPEIINEIPVRKLSEACFVDMNIASVKLPKTLKEICEKAFIMQEGLCNINIPNGTEVIGDIAFGDCTNLESIVLPDSVNKLGKKAFQNCTYLESVILSNEITEIEDLTFSGCEYLEYIKLPINLKSIGQYAFAGCEKLKTIELPETIKIIEDAAFRSCPNLVIYFKGNNAQLKNILTKGLLKDFDENNIAIVNTKEIDNYINNFNIEKNSKAELLFSINKLQKKYAFEEIDKKINNTIDLNEKLKYLTIRDTFEKYAIVIENDELER